MEDIKIIFRKIDLFLSRGYLWHAVERFLYRIPVVAASNYYSIFL